MIGDLTAPDARRLGRGRASSSQDVDHFFHLAAVYDMSADEETNRRANVEGTKHAVELANRLGAERFHHASSIAVSGRYRGLFREDMFDEGQKLADPYSRDEVRVGEDRARASCTVPWRVYRPGIVVGHSQTGEMDKIDGPYYFFKVIQRLRSVLPPWMPVVGLEGGKINIVPGRLRGRGDGPHRAPGRPRRPGVPPHRPEPEDPPAR